jgi:O-methyltransferase
MVPGWVARIVRLGLGRAGYRIERIAGEQPPTDGYERVCPGATFAPWARDEEFTRVFEAIRESTLIDRYRCFELWQLLEQVRDTPGDVLEVGVWRGGSAALIARNAAIEAPGATVYLADTFAGVVKAGGEDSCYRGGEHADAGEGEVRALLAAVAPDLPVRLLVGIFPEETARFIPAAASFRLCHVDVDVYQSARDVFLWVWPRMPAGGVVVFDDYGFATCDGVAKFVDAELRGRSGLVIVHNLNGHAVVVKTRAGSAPAVAPPA